MINNLSTVAGDQLVPVTVTVTVEGEGEGEGESERAEVAAVHDETAVPSRRNQRGMVSAEWAVGIIAAIAIAGVLLAVVTSGPVKDALLKFILFVISSFSGIAR